ncbi:hypothetical protein DSCO28_28630 [Desulfosarcina ovata subsp. sediminis]|uniref:DUF4198 domain-containing protein n=1 Tax=Desulfosarcina ovata subsp. sediminis TaxID=885957 RepID=A0A5K7ZP72_9BACT|nr:DUF4198 domain-containing protein [Desulfosarcina ovata]BBO82297.1 hypothetical protein DSCO28_28630 [Desulfosarcina ovata subsp. sediminis]
MKNRHNHIWMIALAALAICIFATPQVQAHFPWLLLEDGNISPGRPLSWVIGWGHRFPLAGFMDGEELEEVLIMGPGGTQKMKDLSGIQMKSPSSLTKEGAYVIAAKKKSTFYTKTTEGYKRQPKKGLKNVLSSSLSHAYMKAIANVGDAGGKVDTVVGHDLEIVLLANPANLRPGDYLPIKVLFKGKPFKTDFLATYGGFSTEHNVFAYAASTGKDGMGKIRILAPGSWLIKVSYKIPYSDPEMCDTESFLADCTFEIQ